MKRIISLVLTFALVLSLVGCAQAEIDSELNKSGFSQNDDGSELNNADSVQTENKKSKDTEDFTSQTIKAFLSETNGKNMVYSPINVYLALGMLAEITDGETRQQVLDLVGERTIDDLRRSAYDLWRRNYLNNSKVTTLFGSSVWIDGSASLSNSISEKLSEHYFAEAFNFDIGSQEMLEVYKDWLNGKTNNLLKDIVDETEFVEDAILVLTSTIYYKAAWDIQFEESDTAPDEFNLSDDELITCDFMNQCFSTEIYTHNFFTATSKKLGNGEMWFILPSAGTTCEKLVSNDTALELIVGGKTDCAKQSVLVNISVPKFDVVSDVDLKEKLYELGITNAFDENVSEFLVDAGGKPVIASKVKHVARVSVDEAGGEAVAYTEIDEPPGEAPNDIQPVIVEFTLDRPFIFAITGATGDVLFVGMVNNPIA